MGLPDAYVDLAPRYYVAWASALMTRRSHVLYGMLFHSPGPQLGRWPSMARRHAVLSACLRRGLAEHSEKFVRQVKKFGRRGDEDPRPDRSKDSERHQSGHSQHLPASGAALCATAGCRLEQRFPIHPQDLGSG